MNDRPMKMLLIEDNPGDTRLIREMLTEVRNANFDLECVDRLSAGLEVLAAREIDVVLLDLFLPDCEGLETFSKAHSQAPDVPIVVLTGLDDEVLAVKAVREGAQDYIVKGQVDGNLLVRASRYAIERQRMYGVLRGLALIDELTGLYNRRGFFTLAQQQLKLVGRTNRKLLFIIADLDGLKQINDTFGHQEGDRALSETVEVLKETFRETDVIARIGGDEFAVIVIEASEDAAEVLTTRLREKLREHNTGENRRYKIAISMGIARYDPQSPCSIDELLARADKLMYEQKKDKEKS